MKVLFEQVTPKIESSVSILDLNIARFDAPYHFHPELELTWIRKGYGKRYIGGKVSDFESDDLVLVGSNVPHCWINEIGKDPAADLTPFLCRVPQLLLRKNSNFHYP